MPPIDVLTDVDSLVKPEGCHCKSRAGLSDIRHEPLMIFLGGGALQQILQNIFPNLPVNYQGGIIFTERGGHLFVIAGGQSGKP